MSNEITELYRKYLADTGQSDDRSDYELTWELGQWASRSRPELFDAFPGFGQQFGEIREAEAPSLVAGELGRSLRSGGLGVLSTVLGGLSLLTGSDALRRGAMA